MKPNTLLHNRYLIQKELSHKAGRRTLLAKDTKTQDPDSPHSLVIIKIIQFNPDFQWTDLKLFEREAKILQNIDHPSIPKYKDYFETEINGTQSFVLAQTYIQANSLEAAIQSGRTFSEEDILEIANRLLAILSYLHERKPAIVHRDIKPSNILLTDRTGNNIGDLYLIDFGSVHTAASKEDGTITIVGSYGYIPLEQFAGQAVPASDLYSLGMTLLYLATGTHPAELPQTRGKVQIGDCVNPKFARWLERITHPYKDQRFDSAKLAQSALNATDSSYGYYHHLKPTDSTIQLQRDRQRLVIFFDRQQTSLTNSFRQNPVGCGCVLATLTFPLSGIVIILFQAAPIPTAIIFSLVLLQLLYQQSAQSSASRRKVIAIDRERGIWSGFCQYDDLKQVKWDESSKPFDAIAHIAYSPGYTFDHYYREGHRVAVPGSAVTIPAKLSIYAGAKEYQIAHPNITQAEFWWIGKELSDFLGLDLQTIYPSPKIPKEDTGAACGC